jgi:hypothetical protein
VKADGNRAGFSCFVAGLREIEPSLEHSFYLTRAGRRTIGKVEEANKDYPYSINSVGSVEMFAGEAGEIN